jgi:hypothetical protein
MTDARTINALIAEFESLSAHMAKEAKEADADDDAMLQAACISASRTWTAAAYMLRDRIGNN